MGCCKGAVRVVMTLSLSLSSPAALITTVWAALDVIEAGSQGCGKGGDDEAVVVVVVVVFGGSRCRCPVGSCC